MVEAYCQNKKCGKKFFTWKYLLEDGWGKYCSKECRYDSLRKPKEWLKSKNAQRSKKWRIKHPEYKKNLMMKEYKSKWSQIKYYQLRDLVIKKYGGKCKECNVRDQRVLCIDHINGGGVGELRKVSSLKYLRMVLADNSGKYQLLCHNCNWIKRWEKSEVRRKRIIPKNIIKCACGCGKELNKWDERYRDRKYISGHNLKKV